MGKNIKTKKELLLEIEALQAQLKKANDPLHAICRGTAGKPAETKYRALVEQIPAITYIAALDEAGATLYISPQIEAVLGFSPDEWLADPESWVKQLHPEDRERVLAEYKSSRERGQPFHSEYRWLTRDGRVLWCHDSAVLIKDTTGKPLFFQGIATDITELKLATEEIYLLQSVAMAISVCRNLHDALVVAMQKICNYTGWIYGEAWMPNQDGTYLERNHSFYSSIEGLDKFSEYSCGLTFTPGKGLPGRAWAEKQPVWINDVTQDEIFLRAAIASEVGFRTGIAFPVITNNVVVSVFVFYSLKEEERNDHLVKLILSTLSQIGLIIRRIQTEDALRKSEANLATAQRIAHLGSWVWNIGKNEVWWSEETYRIFGLKSKEFIPTFEKGFNAVHPDDREFVQSSIHKAIYEGMPYDIKFRIIRPDGSERVLYSQGELTHDTDGKPTQMSGTVLDITDIRKTENLLKESEEKYRGLVESVPNGIQENDLSGTITYSNKAHHTILGYSQGELIGRKIWDMLVRELDRDALKEYFFTLVKDQPEPTPYFGRNLTKDGRLIDVQVNWTYQRDANGRIVGFISVITDITERKRLESEHELLREQLYRSQNLASIGKLAGGIAHNFNNLLTVIIGFASLLHTEIEENSPFKDYTRKIIKSSQTAADLTQALLAFSRKQLTDLRPVNINEIVRQSVSILPKLIREDIVLTTALTSADTTVMADVGQIEQSLMNLATNARDAMPDGGNLRICTEVMEMDDSFIKLHGYGIAGRYVHIAVSDTGMGMNENTKLRVFDPFFTTKEVGKGTGLGLSSVYGIVKQHGGYINVDSEPGRGATFHIYLPVIESEAEGEESEDGKIHAHFPEGGLDTVLLAEDDPEVREIVRIVFERAGYRVIEAVDGEDAIVKFTGHKGSIKLLVSDLIMPKKNGKEVYEAIRKISPDMKVLFITGYDDNVIGKIDIQKGKFGYLTKPVSPVELLRKVREVLDKS